MADRPILFSAPMVRALLDGRKTQTRRIIKPQPVVHTAGNWSWEGRNGGFVGAAGTHVDENFPETARFWMHTQPGDRLWVREAHALVPSSAYWMSDGVQQAIKPTDRDQAAIYRCDWERSAPPWRPSIHMPRWASRLTLTVTDVRVQRLQDISEGDAPAEGVECDSDGWRDYLMPTTQCCATAKTSFLTLWDSINGAGSWQADPWVAAYTFTVERRNIDAPSANALRRA